MGIFKDLVAEVIEDQQKDNLKAWDFDPETCWREVNLTNDRTKRSYVFQNFGAGEMEPTHKWLQIHFNRINPEVIQIWKTSGKEATKRWIQKLWVHEFEHWMQIQTLEQKIKCRVGVYFFVDSLYEKYGYDECPLEKSARKAEKEGNSSRAEVEQFIENLVQENQDIYGNW